jgi:uncharacterized protein (TIGR02246 family)
MASRSTDDPALDALLAQLDAAASALDVDAFLGLFVDGPDALFAVDGQILQGMPAIRAMHRSGWSQLKSVAFRSVPVSVLRFGDDTAVLTAAGRSRRTTALGEDIERGYALTLVLVRRPGGWRVLQAHESIPREASGEPPAAA